MHYDASVGDTDADTVEQDGFALLDRGYTGHEHFFNVGLIHMNGRMYDAKLGRFLSPDNFIQDPFNTQSFNRFGYGYNNPLKYSDPSGEIFWVIVAAVALIGGYTGYQIAKAKGVTGWGMVQYIVGGAALAVGALYTGAAITTMLGSSLSFAGAGAVAAAAGGLVGGAMAGAGFAQLSGGNIWEGAWKGGLAGFLGGGIGAYIGGGIGAFAGGTLSGGVGAALSDSNIIKGMIIGGAMSWAMFQTSMGHAYRQYQKGSKVFGDLTKAGLRKMTVGVQRSFARGKEFAAWVLENGDLYGGTFGTSDDVRPLDPGTRAVRGSLHTHPGAGIFSGEQTIPYHSHSDLKMNNNQSSWVISQNGDVFWSGYRMRITEYIRVSNILSSEGIIAYKAYMSKLPIINLSLTNNFNLPSQQFGFVF